MSDLIQEFIRLIFKMLTTWILFCIIYKIVTLCIGIEYIYIVPTIAFGAYAVLAFILTIIIMKNNKDE